ncbi:aspartate aminotransferase [Trypanosoma theileri]|uniref:Aspartate aminotransferase n=1 Tax=Trypanosoma theileri TaxID=67003 RepID=A0A1X0P052_9TRYP|nr:aspartate aminotransferase [Trypanosoma theileri]ORC89859.1 aspartate aminotransferase [Trypanosoma theileri]
MGICCDKNAMPVVDDAGRQHSQVEPTVAVPAVPTVEFDYVVPSGALNLTMNRTKGSHGNTLDQSIHTVSECSATLADGLNQELSSTLRDESGRSLMTNGRNEVLTEDVDRFVSDILHLSICEPCNILEESFVAHNPASRSRLRAGSVNADTFTKEQNRYLAEASTWSERLARLAELEQMSRQEIFGAWKMNMTLIHMALKRVVPTIRQFRTAPVKSKQRNGREVLVIHAKDIDVEVDGNNGDKINGEPFAVTPDDNVGEKGFSPREHVEEKPKNTVVAEHYQMMALTAREISITGGVQAQVVTNTWDFLSLPGAANHLNAGNAFFRFVCSAIAEVSQDTLEIIDTFINITSFADEVQENNVPKIDIYSPEERSKYVGILVKAMYILPGVRLSNLTAEVLSSLDYQRNCQPGNNKFEEPDTPYTFRLVKTVIKFVFSVTIQMKVSEINDPEVLAKFKDIDGLVPAKAILLERTKRNIQKIDSTIKVRSVLLYYPVNDGVLVNNQTIVLNTSIPRVVSALMQTFGSQGATEAAQTAKLTRQYLIHRFGDSRS